jgi:hypothetical protein
MDIKQTLKELYNKNKYDELSRMIDTIPRENLESLANRNSELNDYIRSQIKLKLPRSWWDARTLNMATEYGGKKSKSKKSKSKKSKSKKSKSKKSKSKKSKSK